MIWTALRTSNICYAVRVLAGLDFGNPSDLRELAAWSPGLADSKVGTAMRLRVQSGYAIIPFGPQGSQPAG